MFAINHAAASLVIKKKFPRAKMFWLLFSVQFVEILWVIFNYLGIEITTTESTVRYVGDIHLIYMPFSHSIVSSIFLAILAFLIIKYYFKVNDLALPFAIGILSHVVLDLIVHAKDIPLSLFSENLKFGSELYTLFPYLAFILEFAFGVWCWWYFKGNNKLLIVIVIFNLANFTVFSTDVVGLEKYFSDNIILLTTVIAAQILITLLLVGYFYKAKSFSFSELFSINKKSYEKSSRTQKS